MRKSLTLILLVLVAITTWIPATAKPISKKSPIRFFVLERLNEDGRTKVQFNSVSERALLKGLTKAGFNVQSVEEAPVVSKGRLRSTDVQTQRKVSEYIGHVRIQVTGDQALKVLNDQNEKVILKTDISDIEWILDRKAAFAAARKAGAQYVLIAEVDIEPAVARSKQKAYNVSMDASLYRVSDGQVVRSFADDLSRMGASMAAAVREAASYLGTKLAEEIATDPDAAE